MIFIPNGVFFSGGLVPGAVPLPPHRPTPRSYVPYLGPHIWDCIFGKKAEWRFPTSSGWILWDALTAVPLECIVCLDGFRFSRFLLLFSIFSALLDSWISYFQISSPS